MAERRVSAEALHQFLRSLYVAQGLPEEDASLSAEQTVDAELRGVTSHGCVRVGTFLQRLAGGTIKAHPRIRVSQDLPAYQLIEGDDAMGAVAGAWAMEAACEKAKSAGVAAAGVRSCSHAGHIGWLAEKALAHGQIGIVISAAAANLAPWGGAERILGNNPIAFAIPSSQPHPLLFDMATSKVARGYVILAAKTGEPIPEGWALDAEGKPTTDARAALRGTMLPVGDYKGYGLALMFSMLTGALTGSQFDADLPDWLDLSQPFRLSLFALAINPARCLGDEFASRVDAIASRIRGSRLAPGFREIRLPGEGSGRRKEAATREGILLKEALWRELAGHAERLGVPLPPPL
ncbi:MAG: Ldh family oxidoreductase [Nitrospinota bacterium]